MQLWSYEIKKMLFYQKGLLFIGLFLMCNIAGMFLFDKPANSNVELNFSQYAFYLNQVEGAYSEDTERFFASESAKISDAKVSLQKMSEDYFNGVMEKSEYNSLTAPFEKILQNEKGYKIIYDQYIYVRDNPENRFFVYTNGWDGLLSKDNLDLLYLILLLVLVTPVFCYEFESNMNPLILTVKKGARRSAAFKVGMVLITVAVLGLLNAGVKYGFYSYEYGLEHGDFPLQSLSYFSSSTKDLTLFQTFIWMTLCKMFGNICFAMMIMFVSNLIKKYAFTLFFCSAFIIIPYYGMHLDSTKYFLPGPLGFMVSTGFFRGNEYEHDVFQDRVFVVFREVSNTTWGLLFIVTLVISIVMFIVLLIWNTNVWSLRRGRYKLRSSKAMLIVFFVFSFLVGCTPYTSISEQNVYNFSSRQSYDNDRYHFYVDESDLNYSRIVFVDKQTGEKRNLVRNPMSSLMQVENIIYGNGSHVYYMKYDLDKSGFYEQVNRLSIIEVNTVTFDEKIVFEKSLGMKKNVLLNLTNTNDDSTFFRSITAFFIDERYIYFVGQDEVRRVNRRTGDTSVVIRYSTLRHLAFDGLSIYYINEKSQVIKYNTKTGKEETIPELITQYFVLTDSELLFINRVDQQKLYAMNLRDSTLVKITDVPVLEFNCEEQSVFYISKGDMKQYRLDR